MASDELHQTPAGNTLQTRATTLLMAGTPASLLSSQALSPLVQAMAGNLTVHDSEHSTYRDGLYLETWVATQRGIEEVQRILPEHWR